MTELNAEFGVSLDDRIIAEPGYLSYLREHGYNIEQIREAHVVESNSRDMAHFVTQIVTYDRPKDDPELDVIEDQTEIYVCSCEDFQYNKSADVSESMVKPSQCGACKHIRSISKVEKAKEDENQTQL